MNELGKKLFLAVCAVRGIASERAELEWAEWEGDFMTQEQWQQTAESFLAEQPAQQQEQYIGETNVELGFYSDDASNGQQRELVGKVEMGQLVGNRPHESTSNPDTEREIAVITGVDEYGPILGWFKHWINYPVGTKLYTSPPASKPWVGLTDEQRAVLNFMLGADDLDGVWFGEQHPKEKGAFWWRNRLRNAFQDAAIEAKLKDKNGY